MRKLISMMIAAAVVAIGGMIATPSTALADRVKFEKMWDCANGKSHWMVTFYNDCGDWIGAYEKGCNGHITWYGQVNPSHLSGADQDLTPSDSAHTYLSGIPVVRVTMRDYTTNAIVGYLWSKEATGCATRPVLTEGVDYGWVDVGLWQTAPGGGLE